MVASLKLDCFQKLLEAAFYRYGKFVSRHPLPFLIIPIVITVGLTLGVINFSERTNAEYLYSPIDGRAKTERTIIQDTFPENDSYYFDPLRQSFIEGFMYVIITDSQGGNIYTTERMEQVIQLNDDIISLKSQGKSYFELCSTWKGQCRENILLTVLNGTGNTINLLNISYPLYNSQYFLGSELGGVILNSNGFIESAKAVQLAYNLRSLSSEDKATSLQWSHTVKGFLTQYNAVGIEVNLQYSESLDEELQTAVSGIISKFAIAYTVLMSFCVMTCMMVDWVRTKIWFALGGEISAGMAVVTSLGLLSAAGVPFASTVGIMPFLIIGIGIDDMFVMLSAWRHTSVTLPVEERMALTFKTAAISITVTSVTDALAFLVGSLSKFRAVTLFCAYTGVAVIFSYIYAITFLGAILYYSGQREAENKHELTCNRILPRKQAENRSIFFKWFCTGGHIQEDHYVHTHPEEEKLDLPLMTEFIRDKLAPFLMNRPVKIIIILVYVAYVGIIVWGCLSLKEGLKLTNLAPDSSYIIPFFDKQFFYFNSRYGPPVTIAYTDTLDYSKLTVQEEIIAELKTFQTNKWFYDGSIYTQSWLSSFLTFLQMTSQSAPQNMTSFISILRTQFFTRPPFDRFEADVRFNANYTEITASRFIIQSKGTEDTLAERELMLTSRKLAADAAYNITVFNPFFIFYDQYTVIVSSTLQNLGIAVASMLFISLLLLPSFLSVLWVTFSVISICAGVVGFMVLWDVSLDSISMINLIMCIGFSVDFSAHISYHFCISKFTTGNERAIDSLGHLGTPIIQGAVSTILGAVVLSTSHTYIFRTFFKIILLVMLFGFAHAFFVLPVALSMFGPQNFSNRKEPENKQFKFQSQQLGKKQQVVQVADMFQYKNAPFQNGAFQKAPYISRVYVVP